MPAALPSLSVRDLSGRWSSAASTGTSSASCSCSPSFTSRTRSPLSSHRDWKTALDNTLVPQFSRDPSYFAMIVGLIGTTITPWMQFCLQASVVEKGISRKDLNLCRVDVILGCIVTRLSFSEVWPKRATTRHASGQIPRSAAKCPRRGALRRRSRRASGETKARVLLESISKSPQTRCFYTKDRVLEPSCS
jgi:hypothetical protein